MKRHWISSLLDMHKKDDKNIFLFWLFCQIKQLTGFHLFNRCATLFEKNTMPTVGATDVNVYLYFLLTPCAFVRTSHTLSKFIL